MQSSTLQGVVEHLRKLTDPARTRELSDADLLQRFRLHREEAAFTLLVQRHGPMVLNICRRILGDAHEAEDAFQATFLVLVRHLGTIRKQQSLAAWLHSVASRIAFKSRKQSSRQRAHEREVMPPSSADDPCETLTAGELRAALDEEIERLPLKYRTPIVLCYLADKTHEQVALELGWPKSSVTARLARARQLLQQRLIRRGFTAPAGLLAALLTEQTTNAAMSSLLTLSTVRLAVQGGTMTATATVALADCFVKGAAFTKWTVALTLLTTIGFAAVVGSRLATPGSPSEREKAAPKAQSLRDRRDTKSQTHKPRLDLLGDPLPDGVRARMGSGRMRQGSLFINMAFAADGKSIVCGGVGCLRIWDAETGKLRRRFAFDGATDRCLSLALSGGKIIVASSSEVTGIVTVQEFDPSRGKVGRRVVIPDRITNATLSWDGKQLAYAIDKNSVRIHDLATEREIVRIPLRGKWVNGLAFAPDGKSLALSDGTDTVHLHDTTKGKEVRVLKREDNLFSKIVFSPDGRYLASAYLPPDKEAERGQISIWDVATGKELHRLKTPFKFDVQAVFSPDGKYLSLTGAPALGPILWDVATGKEVRRYATDFGVSSVAFSRDGKRLAASSGLIQVWDVATGRLSPSSADPALTWIGALHFSPNGRRLWSHAATYVAWDPLTGRESRRTAKVPVSDYPLAFSPDESLLAGMDQKGMLRLWDATTGQPVRALKGHAKQVWRLFFARQGRWLVSSSKETIRIWDVASGRQLHQFPHTDAHGQALSPDGHWLASLNGPRGHFGREIILWDVSSGREKMRLAPALSFLVNQMVFSPDGRLLVVVGGKGRYEPGNIGIWEVPSGKHLPALEGHKASVLCVAFSPDGRTLATGNYDGTLFLWELATGRKRHQFVGHEALIAGLAFSPNGRLLAASSLEAPVYVWDVVGSTEPTPPLTPEQLRRCWTALAGDDAPAAFQAIRRLTAAPKQTLPFLREHLKSVAAPDLKGVRQLVEALDSADFPTRQKAAAELEKRADTAAAMLQQIIAKEKPTLEVRRTLQQILEAMERKPESLRAIRGVEVLEWIATPDAMRLLGELAKGAADARLTREAGAAKRRLSR